MEAREFNPPPARQFPRHQTYAALISPGHVWTRRRKSQVVAKLFGVVGIQLDLCLRQEHNIKPPAFHRPDGLLQTEFPAIPDVDYPYGKPS